jgi:hypothetical protein
LYRSVAAQQPFRLNDEQSRLASARERAFPTEYQGADSPDTICVGVSSVE